jgi:hypothetical protein
MIDTTQIQIKHGIYMSRHIVDVGDTVLLTNGTQGVIKQIKQQNYLPRFLIGKRWYGKTKLVSKISKKPLDLFPGLPYTSSSRQENPTKKKS